MTTSTTEPANPCSATRYEKLELLGTGASATVWRSTRRLADGTRQPVALKILHPHRQDLVTRFLREAHLTLRLSHPNIVQVYDFDRTEQGLALVQEYVAGGSLAAATLSPAQLDSAFRQSLSALHYLHSKGILHRDVSPHNLLRTTDGRIKLADFGLALADGDTTELGSPRGTAPYASPEALQGLPLDESSDLYSLAAVFFALWTGEPPYGRGRSPQIRAAQHARAFTPLPPSVPPRWRHVLHALLRPRHKRYRSAAEALQAFDADPSPRAPLPVLVATFLFLLLVSLSLHTPPAPAPPPEPPASPIAEPPASPIAEPATPDPDKPIWFHHPIP